VVEENFFEALDASEVRFGLVLLCGSSFYLLEANDCEGSLWNGDGLVVGARI